MVEEMEKEKRRNLRLKVNDITDLIMHKFSIDGECLNLTVENSEKVARCILSEIFGYNTADLDTPVDVESCKVADDIIAQIKSKRSLPSKRKGQFVKINRMKRLISNKVSMGITPTHFKDTIFDKVEPTPIDEFFDKVDDKLAEIDQNNIDPFDAAMTILEKK